MKQAALITGATGGLGKELAKVHAQAGGDLILAGRSAEKLDAVKAELETEYPVQVRTVCADLLRMDAADEIYRQVKETGAEISYLINNAGFGGRGEFHNRSMEQDMDMIRVNIITVTKLMKLFLPEFVARGYGRILNVSSTASLMPGPLQAVYYATKAYVTSLGNAVWEELRQAGSPVTVTTLLPGGMNTGFIRASDMQNTKLFANAGDPAVVARAGYESMLNGERNVIAGMEDTPEFLAQLNAMLPGDPLLQYVYEMQRETR